MNPFNDPVGAFERVASSRPHHPAVIDGDLVVSFGDLHLDVLFRCEALLTAGLEPGGRVAIVAESSADFLSTALAVWRAGGVLVTVYPSSSHDDLQYALESSEPVLVVAGEAQQEAVSAALTTTPIASIELFQPTSVRTDTEPNPANLREPLSLICFSSGTTSRPKAIMLTATAVHNCAETYGEVWHLSSDDRGIVCLPMAWMYGLASTSLALLLRGATTIVVRRARPDLLAAAMRRHQATFIAGVTTTFAKLAMHAKDEGLGQETFGALRLCISGGEPRNEAAFERWTSVSGVSVLDAYCSSECLPLVTYDPTVDPEPRPGSAGKLVPRAQLRIVDANGDDVAAGEVGEGLSTGPGLMLGYWRDPDQTEQALTPDGWYRTKDLVRMDEDGYVFVVGRLSDVIIRGGINISPGEVERALRMHPDVLDVTVVGLQDDMYGERVVAAVVAAEGLDVDALRAHAEETLTAYKRPSEYVVVNEFPVTSTGKVDRRALAARLDDAASTAARD
ncbi:class I adenylate-forming enzyme family protein [Nocardioides astragali]|uniref:Class I adenylate-forming enzyme family protein n=1 Tax=Nocardioides astragali TaxID=1776736 RepID=A0ABW2MXB4_9ACTN|nr:class I adenylate-forming enzyme family protein [Nocardioides astragali]